MSGFNLRRCSQLGLWRPCRVITTEVGAYSTEDGAADAARRMNNAEAERDERAKSAEGYVPFGLQMAEGRVYFSSAGVLALCERIAQAGGLVTMAASDLANPAAGFCALIAVPDAAGVLQRFSADSGPVEDGEPHVPSFREAVDRVLLDWCKSTRVVLP